MSTLSTVAICFVILAVLFGAIAKSLDGTEKYEALLFVLPTLVCAGVAGTLFIIEFVIWAFL